MTDPAKVSRMRRASRYTVESPIPNRPDVGGPLAAAWWAVVVVVLASCVAMPTPVSAAEKPSDEKPGTRETEDIGAGRIAELTKIQAQAETARELRFKQPPVYKSLRADELAPYLRKQMLEEFKESELNDLLLAYEKLGLIPSSEGMVDELVRAYADEVVAFYDQDANTVHLIGDLKVPAVMQRIAELHELVHALQDQNFDLGTLPLKDKLTDPSTAAAALVEGDAMLATYDYAREHAQLALSDLIETALGTSATAPAMPYLLEREMAFVYRNGFDLARALRKRGGWAALNAAFAAPPASTEQVLHYREKYIEARDEPTPVELPDVSAALGEGWRLVANDVLGELYVQTLFRLHLSYLRANTPSRGWDGDRMQFYRPADADVSSDDKAAADAYVLVWSTVWDSERDAKEFAEAYREVMAKKLGADETSVRADGNAERKGPVVTITGEDVLGLIVTEGTRVLTVEGRPKSAVRAALKAMADEASADEGSGAAPAGEGAPAGASAPGDTTADGTSTADGGVHQETR